MIQKNPKLETVSELEKCLEKSDTYTFSRCLIPQFNFQLQWSLSLYFYMILWEKWVLLEARCSSYSAHWFFSLDSFGNYRNSAPKYFDKLYNTIVHSCLNLFSLHYFNVLFFCVKIIKIEKIKESFAHMF